MGLPPFRARVWAAVGSDPAARFEARQLQRDGVMTGDNDLTRTARRLIEAYGEDAPMHAATEAQSRLDQGDAAGHARWVQIGRWANVLLSESALGEGA